MSARDACQVPARNDPRLGSVCTSARRSASSWPDREVREAIETITTSLNTRPLTITHTMNSLRAARAAIRSRPTASTLQRATKRTYADVAPDKIRLSLALPHQSIYKSQDVYVPLSPVRM